MSWYYQVIMGLGSVVAFYLIMGRVLIKRSSSKQQALDRKKWFRWLDKHPILDALVMTLVWVPTALLNVYVFRLIRPSSIRDRGLLLTGEYYELGAVPVSTSAPINDFIVGHKSGGIVGQVVVNGGFRFYSNGHLYSTPETIKVKIYRNRFPRLRNRK